MNPYPRAILHFDGDAFFASIEQSLDHTLKGRPVVTGAERGAATSISYEAKARGVVRGMTMREIRRVCPSAVIVPGNYTAYSLYAKRMYTIVRSFTPLVEEYSIDECFAEITGLEKRFGMSYERIALMMKERLEEELGITFGVGLGPNKSLAKVASKFRKPAGFTAIPIDGIPAFLGTISAGSIWGLGGASSLRLMKLGINTALDFAKKDEPWIKEQNFASPLRDIWAELNGHFIKTLDTTPREKIGSIMKTHTFRPTSHRSQILSELSKNVEGVCAKARRYGVSSKGFSFYLKTQDFTYQTRSIDLPIALNDASELMRLIDCEFDDVFDESVLYRATGITLRSLVMQKEITHDLFGEIEKETKKSKGKLSAIDAMNRRYGKHTVFLASSLTALNVPSRAGTQRKIRMGIEERKKTLNIPYLGKVR